MENIKPKSLKEVQDAFDRKSVVLYTPPEGGIVFMLNPFGGGISPTQEFGLQSKEITEEMLPRILIVEMN